MYLPMSFIRLYLLHGAKQRRVKTIIIYVLEEDLRDSGMCIMTKRLEVELLIRLSWSHLLQTFIFKYLQCICSSTQNEDIKSEYPQLVPFYMWFPQWGQFLCGLWSFCSSVMHQRCWESEGYRIAQKTHQTRRQNQQNISVVNQLFRMLTSIWTNYATMGFYKNHHLQ